eukprot:COSAG06_NODE_1014_length_11069_cov_244.892160_2_plen_174_part_00
MHAGMRPFCRQKTAPCAPLTPSRSSFSTSSAFLQFTAREMCPWDGSGANDGYYQMDSTTIIYYEAAAAADDARGRRAFHRPPAGDPPRYDPPRPVYYLVYIDPASVCCVLCAIRWLRPAVRRYATYTHTAATSSLLQHTGGESSEESASAYMADAFQTSAACVRGMKKREAPV